MIPIDYMRILRRAFEITRIYPALWVFGVLAALTSAKGGGGGGSGYRFSAPSRGQFEFPFVPYMSPQIRESVLGVGIALACVIVLLVVALLILRYVSMNALMRMTDGYATRGEKVSVGAGSVGAGQAPRCACSWCTCCSCWPSSSPCW